MKIAPPLVLLALSLMATAAVAATTPVALKPQPGTPLDATARTLVADDLARAAKKGDAPLVLVGEAHLGTLSDRPAIFIQLQSERECGSAGCNTSVYLERARKWVLVLDSVGGSVSVASARHNGLRDLIVGHDGRWIWNGTTYAETRAAPERTAPRPAAPKPPVAKPPAVKPAAPKVESPATEAPKPEAPKSEAPKSETPKSETPKSETPRAEPPTAEPKPAASPAPG